MIGTSIYTQTHFYRTRSQMRQNRPLCDQVTITYMLKYSRNITGGANYHGGYGMISLIWMFPLRSQIGLL